MPTDFYWTMDGDFSVDSTGDIRDTSFDPARAYFQEIRTRARSDFKDWALHPQLGANLHELIGNINNKLTAEEGRNRIVASMTYGGFLRREQVNVRYIPISKHQLVYFIKANVLIPELGTSRMLQAQILYDTQESSMRLL